MKGLDIIMKTRSSLLYKLLIPIVVTTILLLMLSVATFSKIYHRQAELTSVKSNMEILNQTDISLNLVHDSISQIAVSIHQTPYLQNALSDSCATVHEEWKSRQRLSDILSNTPLAMIDYEITLLGTNGIAISSGNGGVTLEHEDFYNLDVYQKAKDSGYIIYGGRQNGFSYSTQNLPIIYGCKTLSDSNGKYFGAIFLSIPEYSLRQFYQSFSNSSTCILLLSSDGKILSSNNKEDIGSYNHDLLAVALKNKKAKCNYTRINNKSIVLSKYINSYDIYAVSQINPSLLYQESNAFVLSILTMCIVILLLCFFIAIIIRKNLKPLSILAEHMENNQGFPNPIYMSGSFEMEQISTAYNQMIDSLHNYLERLHRAQEQRHKDELNLLQMQINPHFLYNTLDGVKHLIEMNHAAEACQTIDSLIALFRSTLGKTDTLITVADEVKNVKNYIAIVEPRYGGLIHANIDVSSACLNLEIPNLLLQPLIENAFFHAFQTTRTGSIHIFIYQNNNFLVCEITDNGDGMSPEIIQQLMNGHKMNNSTTCIGIINIKERLELLYPDNNSFEIISELGYGTNIILSFPANKFN